MPSIATEITTFECDLALDAESIEAGEQPFQAEPQAGRPLGAIDVIKLPPVAIALDGATETDDEIGDPLEANNLRLGKLLRVGTRGTRPLREHSPG